MRFTKYSESNVECSKRRSEDMFADIIRSIDSKTKLRKQVANQTNYF